MGLKEIFTLSFQALRERRLRAIVTIIMVVVGAALLTGLNGMSAGINDELTKQFSSLGANVIEVLPGGVSSGSSIRLTDQTRNLVANIPGVAAAESYIQRTITIRSSGSSMTAIMLGLDHDKLPEIYPTISLSDGSFGSPASPTVLVGNSIAHPPGETAPFASVGQVVTLEYVTFEGQKSVVHSRTFLVEGVMASSGSSAFMPIDRMVVIPLSAANTFFDSGGKYDGIFVVASDDKSVDSVVNELKTVFGNSAEIFSAKAILSVISNITGTLGIFLSAIASVSLVVAAVGIFAALYTTVLERTREIGVLKALGFNNSNIILLFLGEAILIGLIGGFLGDLAGVGIAYLLTSIATGTGDQVTSESQFGGGGGGMGFVPVFTPDTLIFVWLFSIVLSVFAGVYPAWRASKLDPVVALRKE